MKPGERPVLTEQVQAICEALGVPYKRTKRITIEPDTATVLWYVPGEDGKPQIQGEHAVMTEREWPVIT